MERLAYRFDEDELSSIIAAWPAGVGVALCMSSYGATRVAIYATGAPETILPRIIEATGWSPGTFAVAPKVYGVKAMRVSFSEAQAFLRIVESVEGLLSLAQDFLRHDAPKISPPRPSKPMSRSTVRSGTQPAWQSRISLSRAEVGLPSGFRSASDFLDGPFAVVPAEIRTTGARVRVTIDPEAVAQSALPIRAERVGHRDDLRCFVFGPECLKNWRPGHGMVIDAGMDAFPRALVELFQIGVCKAEVSVTPEGVFVTPNEFASGATAVPERARPANSQGRGIALKIGLLTLIAAGLVSGGVTALQSGVAPIANPLAYGAGEGNAAFNVVQSIALGMSRGSAE